MLIKFEVLLKVFFKMYSKWRKRERESRGRCVCVGGGGYVSSSSLPANACYSQGWVSPSWEPGIPSEQGPKYYLHHYSFLPHTRLCSNRKREMGEEPGFEISHSNVDAAISNNVVTTVANTSPGKCLIFFNGKIKPLHQ